MVFKLKKMTEQDRREIQDRYRKEMGVPVINSQGEFDIDYVAWLEEELSQTGTGWIEREALSPVKVIDGIEETLINSFDVRFGSHLKTSIKLENDELIVLGAINGWGDSVPLDEIEITKR